MLITRDQDILIHRIIPKKWLSKVKLMSISEMYLGIN